MDSGPRAMSTSVSPIAAMAGAALFLTQLGSSLRETPE
jgi:hypothetical protein